MDTVSGGAVVRPSYPPSARSVQWQPSISFLLYCGQASCSSSHKHGEYPYLQVLYRKAVVATDSQTEGFKFALEDRFRNKIGTSIARNGGRSGRAEFKSAQFAGKLRDVR